MIRRHKAAFHNNAKINLRDGLYYPVEQFCIELVDERPWPEFKIQHLDQYDDGLLTHEINDFIFVWKGPTIERLELIVKYTCASCGGPTDIIDKSVCLGCETGTVDVNFTTWRRMNDAARAMRAVRRHDAEALENAMKFVPSIHWMTLSAYEDVDAMKTIVRVPKALQAAQAYLSLILDFDNRVQYLAAHLASLAAHKAICQDFGAIRPL